MSKFKRSWMLLGCTLSVIRKNKRLLMFPLVSFFFVLPLALFFLATPVLWPSGHAYTDAAHWTVVKERFLDVPQAADARTTLDPEASPTKAVGDLTRRSDTDATKKPLLYAYLALVYLASMFMATFLNVAFYNEILHALNGNGASISRGLRFAASRTRAILMWSLLAGIVGLVIKTLEERLSFVGSWIARLVGIAWSVAIVFVIPVIVREKQATNPIGFLRSSTQLLTRTWGEGLIGFLGLQLGGVLLLVASLVWLGAATAVSVAVGNYWLIAGAAALWFVAVIALAYVTGVAQKVYIGALYIYASEGVIPGSFDQEMLNMAWKVKAAQKPQK